jgi:hypothetical protein
VEVDGRSGGANHTWLLTHPAAVGGDTLGPIASSTANRHRPTTARRSGRVVVCGPLGLQRDWREHLEVGHVGESDVGAAEPIAAVCHVEEIVHCPDPIRVGAHYCTTVGVGQCEPEKRGTPPRPSAGYGSSCSVRAVGATSRLRLLGLLAVLLSVLVLQRLNRLLVHPCTVKDAAELSQPCHVHNPVRWDGRHMHWTRLKQLRAVQRVELGRGNQVGRCLHHP